jgi:Ca2+-binding RTX toxin-like protein
MSLFGNIGSVISGGGLSSLFPPPFTGKGTSGDDNVHISKANGIFGALGFYDVEMNGQHHLMTKEQLESTVFDLGSGDDRLTVDSNVDANITAKGGSGDDTMIGGKGNDNFDGGSGDDTLIGGAGNDKLKGGSGDDYVRGDAGHDSLDGGSGNNQVVHDWADFVFPLPQIRIPELFQR